MLWTAAVALTGCDRDHAKDPDGTDPLDLDGDGFRPDENDCDDSDAEVHPGVDELVGNGVDEDCNGTDSTTSRLATAARLTIVGDGLQDALGTSVACSSTAIGSYSTALAVGADQELRATPVERRAAPGDSPGYAVLLDGSSEGEMVAADAEWRADGSDDDDELGHRVVFPGDTDGDGDGELLVTAGNAYRAVTDDEPDTQTGAAFLFDATGAARVVPEDAATWFVGTWGKNLKGAAHVGDVDSDELDDVLLSEANLADPASGGEVRVYLASDLDSTMVPSDAAVRAAAVDPLSPTGDFMAVGEVTGDGEADLVLGELEWQPTGRVVIAEGPPLAWTLVGATEVVGTGDDASFGHALAIGDLDADGMGDLVVGAHISSKAGVRRGAAYLFLGPLDADRSADDSDAQVFGEVDYAWMGAAAAVLDHDGDGLDDLAVSAASDLFANPYRPGLVYVFAGPVAAGELDPVSAYVIYEGIEGGELLGLRLAACDLDSDGKGDLVIGAPGTADGTERRGRAFVVDGGATP